MEQTNNGGETAQRPVFLTVLCILSFIAAGVSFIVYGLAIAVVGVATAVVSSASDMVIENGGTVTETASSGPSAAMGWAYIVIGFLTTIVSLMGVIKMWKLKKAGFMLYTGATVVSLIMGILYLGFGPSVMGIVISAAFIVMYGLNTKAMK